MRENFEQSVKWLAVDEHSKDGERMRGHDHVRVGISWGKAQSFGLEWEDFLALDIPAAEGTLLLKVWLPLGCDELPGGLDYVAFDVGYRFGAAVAKVLLENTSGPIASRIVQLSELQLRRYRNMPGQSELYLHRANRVVRVRRRALQMIGVRVLTHEPAKSDSKG